MRTALVLTIFLYSAIVLGEDLDQLEPKIVKTPNISEKGARFLLLVFGPEGKTKAWLILDGDTVFVDRNANGDLTEPADRVEASRLQASEGSVSLSFNLGEFSFDVGKTKYEIFLLHRKDKEGLESDSMTVRINDRLIQDVGGFGGAFALSRRAKDAPVVHFNGPLTIDLRSDFEDVLHYGLILSDNDIFKTLIPAGSDSSRLGLIIVHVGTPGKRASAFVANQYGGIQSGLAPIAEIGFNNRFSERPPIHVTAVLTGHSCADGFMGVFEFPIEAAEGPAKLNLSFPAWEDSWATDAMSASKVSPATKSILVLRANPEP